MYTKFADLLRAARQRLFVGRKEELDLFDEALAGESRPCAVLYVHGPGGVGKTSLLHMFADRARRRGRKTVFLDTRLLEASPDTFLRALGDGLAPGADVDPLAYLEASSDAYALFFDTTETIGSLDWWLRERFLPALPDRVVTVFAGRFKPSLAWRMDPGWQALVRVVSLRNLSSVDTMAYLERRQVPDERHRDILEFTRGYPLALSLMSDMIEQRAGAVAAAEPDIIQALLTHFLDEAPTPEHRQALHVCATIRHTTEQALALLLEQDDVHAPFEWLRTLSFIDASPEGLFPHDMARKVLMADLQWRAPEWHNELQRRARHYYMGQMNGVGGPQMREVLIDYLYLHRDNPLLKPIFTQLQSDWQEQVAHSPIIDDAFAVADTEALVAMIGRHEGEAAAVFARYWLDRQPAGVRVYRDHSGVPLGVFLPLRLEADMGERDRADPAVDRALDYLLRFAPLREGENALLFRFWLSDETYQGISLIQSMCFIQMVRLYLTTPGLAFSFLPCAEPDLWQTLFAYVDLHRLPEADYALEGRTWVPFGHDWRATPPGEWLTRLASRVPSPSTSHRAIGSSSEPWKRPISSPPRPRSSRPNNSASPTARSEGTSPPASKPSRRPSGRRKWVRRAFKVRGVRFKVFERKVSRFWSGG